MSKILISLVLMVFSFAGTAQAKTKQHHHRSHHPRCTHHRVAKHVRVKRRVKIKRPRHHRVVWIRKTRHVWVWRCVWKHKPPRPTPVSPQPSTPMPAPASVNYSTSVDPAFTQASNNPLSVTYAYNANAYANGASLAAAGQLPAGVLNFYSASTPGGPEQLFCSMNVGGSVDGGNCLVNYAQTGTYQVTTQYVPNSASAVTETDTEIINPYSTTTTESVAKGSCSTSTQGDLYTTTYSCPYTLSASAVDQNGNTLSAPIIYQFTDNSGDTIQATPPNGQSSCDVMVSETTAPATEQTGNFGPYDSSQITSSNCKITGGWGNIGQINQRSIAAWNVLSQVDAPNGYDSSSSASQVVTPY